MSFYLSLSEKILFSENLGFIVEYLIYPSFFLKGRQLSRGCLNKSVIKTGTDLRNPEDQEAPVLDIKIFMSKFMSLANEKQQNQEPKERSHSSVNSSETKISPNTMDSIKGISMEEMATLKKLCPTQQAGESNVSMHCTFRVHFLPQCVMETVELFQGLPNFWLVMSKQMWKLHLKGNKHPSVSTRRMSGYNSYFANC